MFKISKNKAGQQQAVFVSSGIVAVTMPNRKLVHMWLDENFPEWVDGNPLQIIRKATERSAKAVKAMNEPLPASHVLNVSLACNRSVWRARD